MTRNPESIEKYLSNVEPEKAITSAIKHFVTNEAMGFDFWQAVNESWLQYLKKMRMSHTIEQEEPVNLRGYYSALRENWDKEKPHVYEPIGVAKLRYGLITPEEAGLSDEDKIAEPPTSEEREPTIFSAVSDASPSEELDPLADFDFFEEERPQFLRLLEHEMSLNFNNGSFKITFNMPTSRDIAKEGMEYARLAKAKSGDICLILNRSQGVRLSKSSTGSNGLKFNTTLNSKDICTKLRTLLNVRSDYSVLNIERLPSTSDYIIFKVTKQ